MRNIQVPKFVSRSVLTLLLLGAAALVGCETQGWFDPSQPHGFHRTPMVLPILNRLDVLDEYERYAAGISEVQPLDLVPEIREYVVGPNDAMQVTIDDLRFLGEPDISQRVVNELGMIRLPAGIGEVQVAGRTPSQIESDISRILIEKNILQDPNVSVMMLRKQQNTFSIIGESRVGGGGSQFGEYEIPKPDFRVLNAIAMARGIPGQVRTLYVYRTVPLTAEAAGERPSVPTEPGPGDVPEEAGRTPAELIDDLEDALGEPGGPPGQVNPPSQRGEAPPAALEEGLEGGGPPKWVFVGGKWVKIAQPLRGQDGVAGMDQIITQRVIKIPYDRLMNGEMKYNIVIRPGDIIKVPALNSGNIYISGNVARPGTYILPGEKDLTIKTLLAAAGGFGPIAAPQRGELIRRIGEDQEAIIRLDLRRIETGQQPDLFLKPNDLIRVGTSGPMLPLAVIRNGFRMTYGFGFVLDRNFSPEVFGP